MNWINRLKEKWKVKNSSQFALILITFALTGSTVIIIKKPIVDYFTIDGEKYNIYYHLSHLHTAYIQYYFAFLWLSIRPI